MKTCHQCFFVGLIMVTAYLCIFFNDGLVRGIHFPAISPGSFTRIVLNKSEHSLCLVIPYRNRNRELMRFIPYIHKFLDEQKVSHKLLIMEQVDEYRFNRASLINVGFLVSKNEGCDYIAMHDVDLLPKNPKLPYRYPADGPFHVAAPELHPNYHYSSYCGGILLISHTDFSKVNGMSNKFWGWGKEDDEFFKRMIDANLKLKRPVNITTGIFTFEDIHDNEEAPRDKTIYGDQQHVTMQRDPETGFHDVQFDIVEQTTLTVDGAMANVYRVKLKCDLAKTPWCVHGKDLGIRWK